MSTYGRHAVAPSAFAGTQSTPASIQLFRRLTWEGTVPLEIVVAPGELPANAQRGLERYFIQAPRVTYLPLIMGEIARFLADVVFDAADANGVGLKEEEWWFESDRGGVMKWHWPIGLIYDIHTVAGTIKPSAAGAGQAPLRLTLHLASPPTDRLLMSPSAEACKQAFMGQLKEADFIRWGNTKRMTGLRKQEQDAIWEGIKEHSFDDYWRVASKITPTTAPSGTRANSPPPPSSASAHTRPPSADQGGVLPDRDGAYSVRSIPVRVYLPDGPVMQELVPPVLDDGRPNTLSHFTEMHLPLLFPPVRAPLAYAVVQGVRCPAEAELGWLGACMAGADGWVNVCIGIERS